MQLAPAVALTVFFCFCFFFLISMPRTPLCNPPPQHLLCTEHSGDMTEDDEEELCLLHRFLTTHAAAPHSTVQRGSGQVSLQVYLLLFDLTEKS